MISKYTIDLHVRQCHFFLSKRDYIEGCAVVQWLRARDALGLVGVILGEVLVAVGIHDSLVGGVDGELLCVALTVAKVVSAAVGIEMGRLVDDGASLGVGASVGCVPEGTAEVDLAKAILWICKSAN